MNKIDRASYIVRKILNEKTETDDPAVCHIIALFTTLQAEVYDLKGVSTSSPVKTFTCRKILSMAGLSSGMRSLMVTIPSPQPCPSVLKGSLR